MIMEMMTVAHTCLKKHLVQKYSIFVVYKQFSRILKIYDMKTTKCSYQQCKNPRIHHISKTLHLKINETVNYCKKGKAKVYV